VECGAGNDQGGEEDAADCLYDDGPVNGTKDCVGENIENVIGSNFDDRLVGVDPVTARSGGGFELNKKSQIFGTNVLSGCGGNDLLIGGEGADIFEGDATTLGGGRPSCALPANSGFDTVSYQDAGPNHDQPRPDPVKGLINGVRDDGNAVIDTEEILGEEGSLLRITYDSIDTDVEHVIGGAGADTLEGDGSDELLEGMAGNDSIQGGGGNDQLRGGDGDDSINGNDGIDSIFGDGGTDALIGGSGDDGLSGGPGTDLVDYSVSLRRVIATADDIPGDGLPG
jgi:Ca2+-binding RTX toxin-like protein